MMEVKFKVGDLIKGKYIDISGDVGIVTEVWRPGIGGRDRALFADGEHCFNPNSYEVIDEG